MEEEGGYYVNEVDGLPNEHPALPDYENDEPNNSETNHDSFDDLPTSIIVTNIHSQVFVNDELKAEMESLFRAFSDDVTFQWLKSFRRLRVNYKDAISAANARIQLHQYKINESIINCYFAQPVTPVSNRNLQPPAPTKQFLISPPCSPPAGWQQAEECEPIVNQDLLAALANLTPGEVHELHAAAESQPSIVVHTAIVQEENDDSQQKLKVIPTKCPERT
ncbi:CLUMA_CG011296, isoform A [Clunio marinus]|uniref:CLUMA_CG011296, isoform A n=1 Tax=Clunio marinus TaxID=568069 RepID=A0A1J1IHJ4_9DIPT|nr:CLUMA_CG011296, isoform A [Clunio marinus]